MFSAHMLMEAEHYRQTHFPHSDTVIIPPENGWPSTEQGLLYRPQHEEVMRPYRRFISIPTYGLTGYLVVEANYRLSSTTIPCAYVLSGTFSREDVAMLSTCFRKGMGGQFLPKQLGLDIDATHLTTLEKAGSDPWMSVDITHFSTRKPDPKTLPDPHQFLTMDHFRHDLRNRMKYDYCPKAEMFRIRDMHNPFKSLLAG